MTIRGHFDGKVFVPDEPVDLPNGTPVTVNVTSSKLPPATSGAEAVAWIKTQPKIDKEAMDEFNKDIEEAFGKVDPRDW